MDGFKRSSIESARDTLERLGEFDATMVRNSVGESWRRCLLAGLDPNDKPEVHVTSHTDLYQRRQKMEAIMRVVRPELEYVTQQVSTPNLVVALADQDNVILDEIMDTQFEKSLMAKAMPMGSFWEEHRRGTNAVGTGFYRGKSTLITSSEHFFTSDGNCFCASVPVFDSRNRVIATMGATSQLKGHQQHTLSLLKFAAFNVENQLFLAAHPHDMVIKVHLRYDYLESQVAGKIALNKDGLIVGANQVARKFIKSLTGDHVTKYLDLFAGQFEHLRKSLLSGEVVKAKANVNKALNTEYFARLVPTYWHNQIAQYKQYKQHEALEGHVFLPIDSIYSRHKPRNASISKRIFRDSIIRHNLRLGKKAIQRGLTVMLTGGPGSGKNSVAEELHDQLHADQNFITCNCTTITVDSIKSRLIAKLAPKCEHTVGQCGHFDTQQGGTLYLDRIDLLDINSAPVLITLLNQIIQPQGMERGFNGWTVISSTEINDIEKMQEGALKDLHVRLSGFLLFLPQLKSRSDFGQLCEAMLASVSPLYSLSTGAIDALKHSDAISSLSDLDWSVRTLLTHLPEGIIRPDAVVRTLGQRQTAVTACPRCRGRVTKEARCLQIRQMIRQCNGNIALAARSLRVARNTVYLHAPSKSEQAINK